MQSAFEYFKVLSKNARAEHDAWWLISEKSGTVESRRAKLKSTLQYFGKESMQTALEEALNKVPAKSDLSPELQGIIEQLTKDLLEYVEPTEKDLFGQTFFGILPLSAVNAFCLDRTPGGDKLGSCLVVLNEGLYICAQLLAKAFVLENLEGELSPYYRSGRTDFQVAISHYLAPAAKNVQSVFFESVPPEVEGQLSAAQSSMGILIMQFVLLHEFGHVTHQDFDLMGEYSLHLVGYAKEPVTQAEMHWLAEYRADQYALDAICRHSKSDISRWANFLTVYVFFHWLASIEKCIGRALCPLHPPPLHRGERLFEWMHQVYPADEVANYYVVKSKNILSSWDL